VIDPYVQPNGVLRNRFGIEDAATLADAEADIVQLRIISLSWRRASGEYDLAHLRGFHRYLFGDVYDWAGELRTVDIAKSNMFCRCVHLESYGSEVFGKLARADLLRGLDRKPFVQGLAETLGDINALHPFREGNGRTQRAFLQQLALDAGHPLSWAGLDSVQNTAASIASFGGDPGPMVDLLDKHVIRDQ
jgi:cell filamentation protein